MVMVQQRGLAQGQSGEQSCEPLSDPNVYRGCRAAISAFRA
jgi:hypothetical protein